MSAELLREAASKMRQRAEAATSGPWAHDGYGEVGRYSRDLNVGWMVAHPPLVADAEHIASWHPAVALAVADWLDACAQFLEDEPDYTHDGEDYALTVATAYLGSGR